MRLKMAYCFRAMDIQEKVVEFCRTQKLEKGQVEIGNTRCDVFVGDTHAVITVYAGRRVDFHAFAWLEAGVVTKVVCPVAPPM